MTHSYCSLIDKRKVDDVFFAILFAFFLHSLQDLEHIFYYQVGGEHLGTLKQTNWLSVLSCTYWLAIEKLNLGMVYVGAVRMRQRPINGANLTPNIIKIWFSGANI